MSSFSQSESNPIQEYSKNLDNLDDYSVIESLNANLDVISSCGVNEEFYLVNIFKKLLEFFTNKDKRKYQLVYEVEKAIILKVNKWLCCDIANILKEMITNNPIKGQQEYGFKLLNVLIKNSPEQISTSMTELIPIITNNVGSPVKEVKDNSFKCLKTLLNCSGNMDLNPFIPVVLDALVNPSNIPSSVEKLAGCIFVQNVEAPALAVTTPILIKGLNDRKTETKRKCCVIIDNMCKLVEHPKEIISFSTDLKKLLKSCSESISDPEARSIADKALNTLTSACGSVTDFKLKTSDDVRKLLNELSEFGDKFTSVVIKMIYI